VTRLRVARLANHDPALPLPAYETAGAAGLDLRACLPEADRAEGWRLALGARLAVPTGLAFAAPEGCELQLRPRSGLALRHGVTVLNAPGTIDADYRGEVRVLLVNLGEAGFRVAHGARVAQLVLAPILRPALEEASLDETARGLGGFGSTGS
jgi:dUTP pyrophosphatase